MRPATGRARAPEIQALYAFPDSDAPIEARDDNLPRLETTAAAAAALPPEIQFFLSFSYWIL